MALQHSHYFKQGIVSSLPIVIAFSVIFFSQGLLSYSEHLSFWQSICLTAGVFAAPTQNFILDNKDLPLWLIGLNVFILNFKFFLMTSVMVALWKARKRLALPAAFVLTSSSYLVAMAQKNVNNPWAFFVGLAVSSYIIAIAFTGLGFITSEYASHFRPFLTIMAHIVVPLHFTCLTMKRKSETTILIASAIGVVCPCFLTLFIPRNYTILVWLSVAGIITYLTNRNHKPSCEKE